MADISVGVATAITLKLQLCPHTTSYSNCEYQDLATVVFAGPFVILGTVLGAYAISNPPSVAKPPPAHETDATTAQLGREVRSLARSGRCVQARATMDQIAARDAEYHIALLASGALGECQ